MYGRQSFSLPRLTSFVKGLLIVLLASYVLQLLADNWAQLNLKSLLSLNPQSPQLWQFVTYPLVDARDPLFFLFGLLVLWWVLAPFEIGFGAKRTAQLCLVCVLAASLPAWLIGAGLGRALGAGYAELSGTGPLWMGVIAASTYLYRDRPISFFGLGPITAQQFLLVLLGLSLLMFLASRNLVHFIGDLGGMAGGIGFIYYLRRPRSGARRPSSKPSRPRGKGFRVIQGGGNKGSDSNKTWLN